MGVDQPGHAALSGAVPAESAFECAVAMHRRGHSAGADEFCAAAIAADPRHFGAHHLRGLIALAQGDTERGIQYIERALAIDPDQAAAHSNIGNALLATGRPGAALERFDRALRLKPDSMIARYNRGNALKDLGSFDEALLCYEQVLALNSAHVAALNNRGLVLAELGCLTEALASVEQAVSVDPRFDAAHRNRAAFLLKMGRPLEALAAADGLLCTDPQDLAALCTRGNALVALQRPGEALENYTQALRVSPLHLDALVSRGAVLQRLQRFEEALEDCEKALSLAPDSVLALTNTGNVLSGLERWEAALACYERALQRSPLDPDLARGRSTALGRLFHLRMDGCEWDDYQGLLRRTLESLTLSKRFGNPLSLMLFDDAELNLACARAFVADRYPPKGDLGACVPPGRPVDPRRIRVAYVSADFCDHPVSQLLVGVLERHDRTRFEVIGVSLQSGGGGAFDRRVQGAFDSYIEVADRSDREIAALMRQGRVDIAVDLMGFTDKLRLGIFAHRAAPVQVNYLGYAGTSGAPYMDFLLADAVVIPPGEERWYSEQVVRLPHCYLPNDDRRDVGARPTRDQAGLPAQGLVLCAFTKACKINPPVFDIWMRLLREAQGSVLWLRDMGAAARDNLAKWARSRGVAAERLVFAARMPQMSEHLARQALADLYLDTYPYNAHSTACDALWAGVPVLTCAGRSFGSRVAASALAAAGMPELITQSLEEYERRALDLVNHPESLTDLRSRLTVQRTRSPLFDTARYTFALESAYLAMYGRTMCGDSSALRRESSPT